MGYASKAFVLIAFSSPAIAEECKIVWWDLFLPQAEVEFIKTSEVSAKLTLKNTSKHEPASFELAQENVASLADGSRQNLLMGSATLVLGGVSNQVTVTLQPKSASWLVGFASAQTLRSKDGKDFGGTTQLAGFLTCENLKPWQLGG